MVCQVHFIIVQWKGKSYIDVIYPQIKERNFRMLSKNCVPFNIEVPCHFTFPSAVFLRLVVLTVVGRSAGSRGPRSRSRIHAEFAQTHVLFQVKAICFLIQNAVLNILVAKQHHMTVRASCQHKDFPKTFVSTTVVLA